MAEISKRVLLVEDDPSMRKFIEIILTKSGYHVVAAEDGLSALEAFARADFDVIVADAIMPNLSGYELCRVVRSSYPDRSVRYVILSGLEENPDDRRFCDAFLTKDTDLKDRLISTLSDLL